LTDDHPAKRPLIGEPVRRGFYATLSPLGRAFARAGVSPHTLTLGGLLLSVAAGLAFAMGLPLAACAILLTAGLFDVLDGWVARDAHRVSAWGAMLDSTVDRLSEAVVYLGLIDWFLEVNPSVVYLLVGAIVGSFLVSYTRARAEGLGVDCKIGIAQRPERVILLSVGAAGEAIPGTGGWPLIVALWLITVLSLVTATQRLFFCRKTMGDDPPPSS
jgi:CDP-diacylglycerol--glycerol-3-phosphate 3-phosphatidyltransferase